MSNTQYNHRASLLNGLRTGGVRSVSANVPHTAAPGASFNIPHFPSHSHNNIYTEEEEDQVADMPAHRFNNRNIPMTAAVDGHHHFANQQAQYSTNPNNLPFSPGFAQSNMMSHAAVQNQSMSMQMLQLEMMRIQALQNQQYQAELIAQAQLQQQIQNAARRSQPNYNPPATAGPTNHSFDLRAATLSAQIRRANQADQLRAQLGLGAPQSISDDQVPMTAALSGRFGSRSTSMNAPNAAARHTNGDYDNTVPPPTPGSTTVISGGTSLGNPVSSTSPPSKSDTVSSWRRGGNNNSVLSGNRAVSSPVVKITPISESERVSPPLANNVNANSKFRPQPLHFNAAVSQPLPAVTVVDTDEDPDGDSSSVSSGKSHSSPTTPRSSASSNEMPLSPREEASKKLYEGLGIGRPTSALSCEQPHNPSVSIASHRMVSQPTRQPRGPPSGADELGPKNFATRLRRKAIGGLGALMDARERREFIEAY